jgi:hypothetical protein
MAINKVVYGNNTLIDLTGDTVTADKILKGYKAHAASGEQITGTSTFDADTQDATATADEILAGETAYNKGNKVTGTMKNNGGVAGKITKKAEAYAVPQGYHDGSGKVSIDANEQAKIIPENIREGISILGVNGSMNGSEGVNPQAKEITPSAEEQVVLPDAGYNYLTQVTVKAIPYEESANSAGGKTATIG